MQKALERVEGSFNKFGRRNEVTQELARDKMDSQIPKPAGL